MCIYIYINVHINMHIYIFIHMKYCMESIYYAVARKPWCQVSGSTDSDVLQPRGHGRVHGFPNAANRPLSRDFGFKLGVSRSCYT